MNLHDSMDPAWFKSVAFPAERPATSDTAQIHYYPGPVSTRQAWVADKIHLAISNFPNQAHTLERYVWSLVMLWGCDRLQSHNLVRQSQQRTSVAIRITRMNICDKRSQQCATEPRLSRFRVTRGLILRNHLARTVAVRHQGPPWYSSFFTTSNY